MHGTRPPSPATGVAPRRLPRAVLLAVAAWPALLAAAEYAGRSLDDALHVLARQGLHLIYSDQVVPPTLKVEQEPAAGPPEKVLQELLAPHGLVAKPVGHDSWAIVRQDAPGEAPVRATAPAVPLEDVIVEASHYSLSEELPDAHTFLTQQEIVDMPRLADDPLKAVQRLPGAATNGVSGLAYMRGGENIETLVTLDGFPLYEPFHLRVLQSPTSLLDPAILEGLDVHAGGFTAEYGDRMSALINATSVHPEGAEYQLGLSMFNASGIASNRFADGRGQWLVAVRGSNLNEIANLVDASYEKLRYSDAFGRLDYEFTPDTRASLHVLASSDKATVENSIDTEATDATYHNSYFWATLVHDFSPAFSATAIGSYTYVKSSRQGEVDEEGLRYGVVDDRRHYDVLGLKLDAIYRSERWVTRFGGELRSLDASYDYHSIVQFEPGYPFPGDAGRTTVNDLSPQPTGAHYSLYSTTRVRLAEPLTAEVGLRWDDDTYTPRGNEQWGPRVNLAWQAAPQTLVRASWGIYQQSEGINELQVEDGIDRYFRPQRATQTILGVEQGLPSSFTLRVEGYVKDYSHPRLRFESLYDPTSLVPELRWDRVAIWPDSSRAEGIDMLLTRRSTSPWNGWINYSWSRVYDHVGGRDTLRGWDQTNNLGGGISWSQGPWQATLAATYHTGWPTTPARVVGPAGDGPSVVIGPRNAGRLGDYASVDARVSRDFALPRGTLNVFAEVSNAFDRSNPCCTDFSYSVAPDGTVTLTRRYRDWLPLIPNVGVLWRF